MKSQISLQRLGSQPACRLRLRSTSDTMLATRHGENLQAAETTARDRSATPPPGDRTPAAESRRCGHRRQLGLGLPEMQFVEIGPRPLRMVVLLSGWISATLCRPGVSQAGDRPLSGEQPDGSPLVRSAGSSLLIRPHPHSLSGSWNAFIFTVPHQKAASLRGCCMRLIEAPSSRWSRMPGRLAWSRCRPA
jgi:hypothetical protein